MKHYTTEFAIAATPYNIHPQSATILAKATAISKELGIYSETFYSGHHTMTNYILTDTPVERSILTTVWFSTLYFLDDFFGEDMNQQGPAPDFKTLFGAWTTGRYPTGSIPADFRHLFDAVVYCSQRIQANSNASFFKRYTQWLYQHMLHTLHPVDYQTVEEYIESRIYFGGMYPTMGMIEYANDRYIEAHLFKACPALQQVVRECALIGVLSNDLISYHKEKHSQQNLLNAYLKTGVVDTLEAAIGKGLAYVNECYYSFVQHSVQVRAQLHLLPAADQVLVETYLVGLERLIAASYHWQMSTNRYRVADNIFEDLKTPLPV